MRINKEKMKDEWQAWQDVCEELRALGIEPNDNNQLMNLLIMWGNRKADMEIDLIKE